MLRVEKDAISGRVEVKCPRCKRFTILQALASSEPRLSPERPDAPDREGERGSSTDTT